MYHENRVTFQVKSSVEGDGFVYKPSVRLEEMENKLANGKEKFVPNSAVKESITNDFSESMKTPEAQNGWENLKRQWDLMLKGSEASRVIGTVGDSFYTVVSSDEGTNIINSLVSTLHMLLSKIGEKKTPSDLNTLLKTVFLLLASPEMPNVVNEIGNLVIRVANKENATPFVIQLFKEVNTLLRIKGLDCKLNKLFTNIILMMKNYDDKTETKIVNTPKQQKSIK